MKRITNYDLLIFISLIFPYFYFIILSLLNNLLINDINSISIPVALIIIIPVAFPFLASEYVREKSNKLIDNDVDKFFCRQLLLSPKYMTIGSITVIPLLCYFLLIRKNSLIGSKILVLKKYLIPQIAILFIYIFLPLGLIIMLIGYLVMHNIFYSLATVGFMVMYIESTVVINIILNRDSVAINKYIKWVFYPFPYIGYLVTLSEKGKEGRVGSRP